MTSPPRRLGLLAALLMLASWAPRLQAQPSATCPVEKGKAAAHARKMLTGGQKALKDQTPSEALRQFQESYACVPTAAALLGVADAQSALGRLADAYESYDRAESAPGGSAGERRRATAGKDAISARSGVLTISVEPGDAEVQVDGVTRLELSKPMRLVTGVHMVAVRKSGHATETREVNVEPRSERKIQVKLVAHPTAGVLNVRESMGRQGHLVVEGLDVGPLPWRGTVEPGGYRIWIQCQDGASAPTMVDITAGQTTSLTLAPEVVAAPVAMEPRPECSGDRDCPSDRACEQGRCVKRVPVDPYELPPPAKLGEECGDRECGTGLVCVASRCVTKEDAPFGYRTGLGAEWRVAVGAGGDAQYPAPMHVLMGRLEVPLAPMARYHLSTGYMNLNANGGFRISPLGFGVPIPVWKRGSVEVLVEPGIDALSFSAPTLLGEADVFLSSSLWGRVIVHRQNLFVTATPIMLEYVFMRGIGDYGEWGKVFNESGINYAGGVGLGVLL